MRFQYGCVFSVKKQGYCMEISRLLLGRTKHDTPSCFSGHGLGDLLGAKMHFYREGSCHTSLIVGKFLGGRWLSSLASEESCENVLKETFMDLEKTVLTKPTEDIDMEEEVEKEFNLEPRRLVGLESEDGLYLNYRKPLKRKTTLELLRTIINRPARHVHGILRNFVEAGEDLNHIEASKIKYILWKHHMYHKAWQISEWLETTKQYEHSEHDYASHLDLLAKVLGVDVAEKYLDNVPTSCRGELLYRTLLANCVRFGNVNKSMEVFEKMRSLGLAITIYTLNQMIILYKMSNKTKIPEMLSLMKKENMTPSLLTYKILIAARSESGDMMGMEQLVEGMKSQGLHPDTHLLTDLARYYIFMGFKDKAIAILKQIDAGNLQECIMACNKLLPLYASLDMVDDVSRIWNLCKSDPTTLECEAAIGAWGKLGKVEEAEAVFEMAMQKLNAPSSRLFSELLRVYVLNNQISKGKEFIERMRHFKCWSGPLVWDGLVTFNIEAGDVEKAASILSKASLRQSGSPVRPFFKTYIVVMEQYAKCGDIHNTEKWFHRMKQCGYTGRLKPYQILVQAYLRAKTPAYGLRERMKAENVVPNKELSMQLLKINAL